MKRLLTISLLLVPCVAFAQSSKSDRGLLPELKLDQTNEDVNAKKAVQSEVLISKSEAKAIAALNAVIKKKKGTPQEADLWYRMAELYMRRAKSGRFFDLTRGQDDSPVKFAPPEVRDESAIANLKQAISIYNKIEKDFPKFPDMDSVLFNNAFSNQQVGNKTYAQILYQRMVDNHKKSPLVPDAHLALGEMAYDGGKFAVALEHFQAIQKYPGARVYSYGMYKEAWAHYNLHQNEEGIQSLLNVVKFFDPANAKRPRVSHNLRSEALRDLALFFGENHSAEEAYKFFAKICQPEELGESMINMGKLYDGHGRQKEMNVFLAEYLDKNPDSNFRVKAEILLINGNETLKNRPAVVKWMEAAAETCRPTSAWRKGHPTTAEAECDYDLARTNVEMAKKWWEIWLKNKNSKEMADLTEKAFKVHLDREDPLKPDAKSHYAYAELLFQQDKFREASEQYAFVAKNSKDTTMAHDAAYSSIVALEKAEAKSSQSGDDAKLRELCEFYMKNHPKGTQVSQVRYKVGFLAYEAKAYEEAEKWLKPLALDKKQDVTLRTRSQDLILDILNARQDLPGIRDFAKSTMDQTDAPDRKKNLQKIMQQADYKSIQQTVEKDESGASIQQLVKFYKENKGSSDLAQDSLRQAVALSFAKGFAVQGSDLALEYARTYPNDPKSTDALKEAAKFANEQGFLMKAASLFELLSTKVKGDEQTKLYEAISEIYAMEGRKADAREFLNKLLETQKDKKEIGKIYSRMLLTYKGEENSAEYAKLEGKILSLGIEPSASEIRIKQIEKLFQNKKYTEAFNAAKPFVAPGEAPDRIRARARLIQAQVLEQELIQQSTKTTLDRLPLVLSLKTEKLDKAQTAFLTAGKISDDPNVQLGSLEGLARAYRNYVDTVGAPIMKTSMKDDEKKALDAELAKLVTPIREKQLDIEKKLKALAKTEKVAGSNQADFTSLPVTETVKPAIPELNYSQFAPYFPHLTQAEGLFVDRDQKVGTGTCSNDPKDLSQELAGLMVLANNCLAQKKFQQLEKVAEQIAQRDTKTGLAAYYMSVAAGQMGNREKALYLIDLAMKKDKDKSFFWFQKAVALAQNDERAQANQLMIKAYDERLDAWETKMVHGVVAFTQGDCFSVSDDFKALPSDAAAKFQLFTAASECQAQKGEVDQALAFAQATFEKYKTLALALQWGHLAEVYKMDTKMAAQAYTKAKSLATDAATQDWIQRKLNWLNNPTQVTSDDQSHVQLTVAQDKSPGARQ